MTPREARSSRRDTENANLPTINDNQLGCLTVLEQPLLARTDPIVDSYYGL
jgi:hypothetical protein